MCPPCQNQHAVSACPACCSDPALQALQLVVVAVHSRALSLLYVDQLLEDVKQVILVTLYSVMAEPLRCLITCRGVGALLEDQAPN